MAGYPDSAPSASPLLFMRWACVLAICYATSTSGAFAARTTLRTGSSPPAASSCTTAPQLATASANGKRAWFRASRRAPCTPAPVMSLRGGLAAGAASLTPTTIDGTFNLVFAVLAASCASLVAATRERTGSTREEDGPSKDVRSLQRRFLLVFWLYKMADWLQGPYFYEVYASKVGPAAMPCH